MLGIAWLSFNFILAAAGIFYVLDYFGLLKMIPIINTLSGKMPKNPILLIGAILLIVIGMGWVSVDSIDDYSEDSVITEIELLEQENEQVPVDQPDNGGGGHWYVPDDEVETIENISFKAHEFTSNEYEVSALKVADLNGDGKSDVIIPGNEGPNYWFENNSDGTFSKLNLTSDSRDSVNAEVADLNGDGKSDVIIGNAYDDKNYWYENNGDGTFTEHQFSDKTDTVRGGLKVADINDDGHLDIVTGNTEGVNYWYENDGSGSFTKHNVSTNTSRGTGCTEVADINGDGYLDIIYGNFGGESYPDGANYWFENNGNGTFTEHKVHGNKNDTHDISAVDINGNGRLDLVTGTYNNDINIYKQNADGTFTKDKIDDIGGDREDDWVEFIETADINADGHVDIVAGYRWLADCYYENNGDGTFTEHIVYNNDAIGTGGLDVADMNDDGYLDIIIGYEYEPDIWVETTSE